MRSILEEEESAAGGNSRSPGNLSKEDSADYLAFSERVTYIQTATEYRCDHFFESFFICLTELRIIRCGNTLARGFKNLGGTMVVKLL